MLCNFTSTLNRDAPRRTFSSLFIGTCCVTVNGVALRNVNHPFSSLFIGTCCVTSYLRARTNRNSRFQFPLHWDMLCNLLCISRVNAQSITFSSLFIGTCCVTKPMNRTLHDILPFSSLFIGTCCVTEPRHHSTETAIHFQFPLHWDMLCNQNVKSIPLGPS